jgi:hypothetical protein
MNHALQVVYLTSIVKSDLKTDILKLRRGAPKDFNRLYLEIFTKDVLEPLRDILKNKEKEIISFKDRTQRLIAESLRPSIKEIEY